MGEVTLAPGAIGLATAPILRLAADDHWRSDAACTGFPVDWWHAPDRSPADARAKAICAGCPVAGECAGWAVANDVRDGLWGGMRDATRRRAARRQGFRWRVCPDCGDAYERWSHETRCRPCAADAVRAAERRYALHTGAQRWTDPWQPTGARP